MGTIRKPLLLLHPPKKDDKRAFSAQTVTLAMAIRQRYYRSSSIDDLFVSLG
jgi:hypothetical protein